MRGVKALMIGRLSLTWLWAILWLIALPNTQARVMPSAESIPTAFVNAAAPENQPSEDLVGIHFRLARSTRRFESHPAADDTHAALWLFQVEIERVKTPFCSCIGSPAPVGLASGWQFHWRTALSPRAPSFVS